MTEHGTPVSRYEQLMAAGGPQMLATSNVLGADAVVLIRSNGRLLKVNKVKVKFSHTRYRALGPELIPVYRQSARR